MTLMSMMFYDWIACIAKSGTPQWPGPARIYYGEGRVHCGETPKSTNRCQLLYRPFNNQLCVKLIFDTMSDIAHYFAPVNFGVTGLHEESFGRNFLLHTEKKFPDLE